MDQAPPNLRARIDDAARALILDEPGAVLVRRVLELARDEDLTPSGQDLTTRACATPDQRLTAAIELREPGVVAGLAAVPAIIEVFGGGVVFEPRARDGDAARERAVVGVLRGDASRVLTLERTVLNLLGRLCGVATRTASFVRAVEGTGAMVCDTRKTTPGLRMLEKYAVVCGGGVSHRISLGDAVLIKDNHLAHVGLDDLAPFVERASARARESEHPPAFVEVEADSLAQFERVLTLGDGVIDYVLLDNFTNDELRTAVSMRAARPIQLEASGGVRLDTVGAIARTGVDRVSVGGLTHQAVSLDVGLDAISSSDGPDA